MLDVITEIGKKNWFRAGNGEEDGCEDINLIGEPFEPPICPNCGGPELRLYIENVQSHKVFYHEKDRRIYISGAFYKANVPEKYVALSCPDCGKIWESEENNLNDMVQEAKGRVRKAIDRIDRYEFEETFERLTEKLEREKGKNRR